MRPLTALALLSRWVKCTFPETEPIGLAAREWLDDMVVPEGCEDMLREIQDGAEVCDRLIMSNYGDLCDVESDREAIAKSLDAYWKAHAQIVHTPERWAVDLASLRTNASDRIT
jgi:enoyl reductase-like protein